MNELVKKDGIAEKIYLIRGVQVMLDRDLAELYGVETKVFNQAVKRNIARFPEEFRFQILEDEFTNLRSQNATSSGTHGGRRYLPYVFTEQGVDDSVLTLLSKRGKKVASQQVWTRHEPESSLTSS
jgi:hypothetical protein